MRSRYRNDDLHETRDVAVGDVTFHLHESGPRDADPIVFVHGAGPGATALANWGRVIDDLGDAFRCVAPDMVGCGESTHPDPPPQGVAAFTALRVRTLRRLLDVLGLDRVTLVGSSMGAVVSLLLAREAPGRVRSLVLVGAGGAPVGGVTRELVKLVTFYDDPTVESLAELLGFFVHDPAAFGDLHEAAAARMPRTLRPEVERSHRAMFAPAGAPVRFDEAAVAGITQPTLVLHGGADRIVPPEAGRWFAEHLPDARLEVFADTGHWLQVEHPERFVAAVRSFLADRRPRGQPAR